MKGERGGRKEKRKEKETLIFTGGGKGIRERENKGAPEEGAIEGRLLSRGFAIEGDGVTGWENGEGRCYGWKMEGENFIKGIIVFSLNE